MIAVVHESIILTRHWHRLDDGSIQCDVCRRVCMLRDGKRSLGLVRANQGDRLAQKIGVRYAYTGKVCDEAGGGTNCHRCGTKLIGKDWYEIAEWNLIYSSRSPFYHSECRGVLKSGSFQVCLASYA